jgi:hypothetical protein
MSRSPDVSKFLRKSLQLRLTEVLLYVLFGDEHLYAFAEYNELKKKQLKYGTIIIILL